MGDFPPIKRMQGQLVDSDFTRFPKLNMALIDAVEIMLSRDLNKVMKMLPSEEQKTKDKRIKGGVFGYSETTDPFTRKTDLSKPMGAADDGWAVSLDAAKYDAIFERLGPNADGKVSGKTN